MLSGLLLLLLLLLLVLLLLLLLAVSRALENSMGTPHFLFRGLKEHQKLGYSVKSRGRENFLSAVNRILEFEKPLIVFVGVSIEWSCGRAKSGMHRLNSWEIIDFQAYRF